MAGALASRGYAVAACAHSQPVGPYQLSCAVDIADADAVERFAADVRNRLGPIDLWINNAGVLGPIGPVNRTSTAGWSEALAVNVMGTVAGCRAFLANRSDGATVVNIASRAGLRPGAGIAAYSATKAAVIALTKALDEEERGNGVRVRVVIPPSVDTDMQSTLLGTSPLEFPGVAGSRARRDAGGIMAPDDAAQMILYAAVETGDTVVVDLSGDDADDPLTLLHAAHADFELRLRRVGPGDWANPTPCAGWDVRALVNHIVGGNRRYVMLLHGASAEDTNSTRDLDHLGGDPVTAFLTTATELEAAFTEAGALGRSVDHRFGKRTGAQLLALRVIDITVYGWDLAQALGIDDNLDPTAIDYSLAHAHEVERLRAHGVFATPTAPVSPSASPQERLLHLTGRQTDAGWRAVPNAVDAAPGPDRADATPKEE